MNSQFVTFGSCGVVSQKLFSLLSMPSLMFTSNDPARATSLDPRTSELLHAYWVKSRASWGHFITKRGVGAFLKLVFSFLDLEGLWTLLDWKIFLRTLVLAVQFETIVSILRMSGPAA